MYWGLYQTLLVLAAGASAGAWLVRPVRPVLPMAGSALWTILMLQARNLTVITGGTSSAVDGGQAWQLVALGMALLNIATVVLWYLGVYPPTPAETAGAAAIPGQEAD